MNNIELNSSCDNVLVWESPIREINKKTTITVPSNYKVILCKNGERIGRPIEQTSSKLVSEAFGLDKSDYSRGNIYSFHYVANDSAMLTFLWGVGNVIAVDSALQLPYKWGGHGSYSISVENPLKLKKLLEGNPNPICKEHIDGKNAETVFNAVKMIIIDTISNILKEDKIPVVEFNSKLLSASKRISDIMKADVSLLSKLGLKIVDFSITNIGLNEEQLELVRVAYKKER